MESEFGYASALKVIGFILSMIGMVFSLKAGEDSDLEYWGQ